jgi:hypothetical protein
LWAVGIALLACDLMVLRQQERLLESRGPGSASYRRVSLVGRGLGAGMGLIVIVILCLMVFKPGT